MFQGEYHTIRVTLNIKKVLLSVKFPCSIYFQLRSSSNNSNVTNGRMNHQLKNGVCMPNEKITIDANVLNNDNVYKDSQVSLVIYMTSSNGKIAAGSIDFKLTSDGKLVQDSEDAELSVEKCPDKNAKAIVSFKSEFIRSQKKVSGYDSAIGQRSKVFAVSRVQKFQPNYEINIKKHSDSQKNISRRAYTRNIADNYDEKSESSSGKRSIIYDEFDIDKHNGKNSVKKLEKEKNEYKKEVAKLKNQIYQIKKEEKWGGYETQIQRYRSEIDSLANELVIVKQKNRNLEKKDKDNIQSIKNLKQQMQKLASKSAASETLNVEVRLSNEQKQHQIKKLLEAIKEFKQEIQDLKIKSNMQEKRIQFKENTYKEQLQKMSEKYQQSEAERQKATHEVSQMLNQFEKNEKKNQLQNKERERGFLQEKNKLTKRIEGLNTELESLKDSNSDLNTKISELQLALKFANKSKDQISAELEQTKSKLEAEQTSNKKLETKNSQNEKQLIELRQVQQDHIALKKKHSETSSELIRVTENYNRANKNNSNLQIRLKQLETNLMGTSKDKDGLMNKTHDLHKQIEGFIKNIELKDREINELNDTLSEMSNKLSEYRVKLDSEKMEHEETSKKLSGEIVYLIKTNEYQSSEMEQLKWKLHKSQELSQNINQKCSALNEKILKISEELINEQQKLKNMKETNKEQENSIQLLRNQILAKQSKEKELLNTIKAKNDSQFQLKRKIKQKEQEIYLLKEKDRQRQAQSNEKSQHYEQTINQRQEQLIKLKKQLEEIKSSLDENILLKEQHSKNIEKIQSQNSYQSDTITGLKNKITELEKIVTQLQDKLKDSDESNTVLKGKVAEVTDKLSKKNSQFDSLKAEWEKYRKETYDAMQKFFAEINKQSITEQTSSQFQLLTFPDENLSNIQIQAFKKRVQIMNKHAEQSKEFKEANSALYNENEKTKQILKLREEELEGMINREKEKFKNYCATSLQEANELSQKIIGLEDKLHSSVCDNQKLSLEISTLREEKEELSAQIEKHKQQIVALSDQIKSQSNNIEALNKQNEHFKYSSENQLQSMISEYKAQIEKLKANIKEQDKKISVLEQNAHHNEQQIQSLTNQIAELVHTKQKLEKKIEFGEIKYSQLTEIKKRIQNELSQIERKLKNVTAAEDKQRQLNSAQVLKNEDLSIRLNKANAQKQELQAQIDKLNSEIEGLHQQISDLENSTNKIKEINKSSTDKSSQTIKQLQEKIITLNSEIQLKTFLTQQQDININQLKQQIEEFSAQLTAKKNQITILQEQNQNVRNQIIFVHENFESLKLEKQMLEAQISKQKQLTVQLNNELLESQVSAQILSTKERELDRLREENFNLEAKNESTSRELRNTVAQLRKQLSSKSIKEEELKRKIREMQREYETRYHDMKSDKVKVREESDREKLETLKQLEALDRENKSLRSELDYLRETFSKQLDDANDECAELTNLLTEKEEQLNIKNEQIKDGQKKLKIISAELKNCYQGWQKDKTELRSKGGSSKRITTESNLPSSSKYQKFIDQIDSRSKNLLSRSKVGDSIEVLGKK